MNELVEKLSGGDHKVTVKRMESASDLKEAIDRKYVLVTFTETQGGTELGINLDMEQSSINDADFEAGTGTVKLAGNLVLNYNRIQCVADIDIKTMEGTGGLEFMEEVV